MGNTNFIVIPSLKIAVEVGRNVNDIEDYETEALEHLVNTEDWDDIGEKEIIHLNIHDLSQLYVGYDIASLLFGLDFNKFLLYWLEKKNISFEISSEYEIDKQELKGDGYIII